MKRIMLTTAYLTVLNAPGFAQLPTPSLASDTTHSRTVRRASPSMLPARQTDEFTPLNNSPFFPGGPHALEAYLLTLDLYPHQARETNVEGSVQVRFRVMPTGYLTQVEVVQSCGPLLDHAALKAVAGMPRWYPAHRGGAAISSLYELLITFRLD